MSNKSALSYPDYEITRNADSMRSKSSGRHQRHGTEGKAKEDEMVRYILKLPIYLENGKKFQEKPRNVGVLNWRHLEREYNYDSLPDKNSGYSPSTSNNSFISLDGSSCLSSRGHSSSPDHQRMHRSSSQSHSEASPLKNYSQDAGHLGRGCSSSLACQRTYHFVPQSHHTSYPLKGHSRDADSPPGNAASVPSHMIRQQKFCGLDQTFGTSPSGNILDTSERKVSSSSTSSEMWKEQMVGNLDLASSWKGKLVIRESEPKKQIMQSQEPNLGDSDPNFSKEHQILLLLPRDPPQTSRVSHLSDSSASDSKILGEQRGKSFFHKDSDREVHCSNLCSPVPYSCPPPYKDDSNRQSEVRDSCSMVAQGVKISSQQFKSPSKSRNTVDKKLIMGLKSSSTIKLSGGSDKRSGSESTTKVRHPSPIRRLSSAVGSIIRSAGSREKSPLRRSSSNDSMTKLELDRAAVSTSSDEPCIAESQANSRARSSPLRRLLDPLIKSKAPNVREADESFKKDPSSMAEQLHPSKEHPMIVKYTFNCGRPKTAKDPHQNLKQVSPSVQALLQVAVKNGLPLFTFAVNNDTDILAATLRKLTAPEKICSSWIYTFFTVQEIKRKSGLRFNQGTKGNGQSYVPNVIAQMRVSNAQFPADTKQKCTGGVNLREFTLFSVDTGHVDQHATEFQPTNELAAIVVKILKATSASPSNKLAEPADPSHISSRECSLEKSADSVDTLQDRHSTRSQSLLSTTVILPGGVHTMPSKGSISTLTQRWRLGGSCDCGGWDVGCQLRVFTSQGESKKLSSSSRSTNDPDELKLFSRSGQETQLVLSLNPFKDRIYSVEFDSSMSLLQAFATCVAVLDCRRPSGLFSTRNVVEGRTSTAVISDDPFRMKVT